jgi:hypothetical protein
MHTAIYNTGLSTAGLGLCAGIAALIFIPFTDKSEAMEYMPLLWLMLVMMILRALSDVTRLDFFARHEDTLMLKSNILGVLLAGITSFVFLLAAGIYGIVLSWGITYGLVLLYWFINRGKAQNT